MKSFNHILDAGCETPNIGTLVDRKNEILSDPRKESMSFLVALSVQPVVTVKGAHFPNITV
jgi:hypothetical protein